MCDSSWHHYTASLTPRETALYVDGHLVTIHVSSTLELPLDGRVQVRDGGELLEDWTTDPLPPGPPTLAVGHIHWKT